jgi:hypothetical protein
MSCIFLFYSSLLRPQNHSECVLLWGEESEPDRPGGTRLQASCGLGYERDYSLWSSLHYHHRESEEGWTHFRLHFGSGRIVDGPRIFGRAPGEAGNGTRHGARIPLLT